MRPPPLSARIDERRRDSTEDATHQPTGKQASSWSMPPGPCCGSRESQGPIPERMQENIGASGPFWVRISVFPGLS
jgi:hypothetical protein